MSRPAGADRRGNLRLAGGRRFAVIASRFNSRFTRILCSSATASLSKAGAGRVDVMWVPGAFELPLAARSAALTGRYHGIVCVGAVIRGETTHHEHVASGCVAGIQRAMQDTGVPIGFGVITADTEEQARARACRGRGRNLGADAAAAVVAMVRLLEGLGRESR